MIEAGPLRTVHNRAERRRWICRIEKSKRHVGEDGVVKKYQENTQRSQVIEGRDSLCSQGFCLVSATIKGPVCHRTFSSFSFSPNSCCEGIQKYNAIYMPITLVSRHHLRENTKGGNSRSLESPFCLFTFTVTFFCKTNCQM
ncbi:hypothetical protein ES705_28845 [subsurface metagenome]